MAEWSRWAARLRVRLHLPLGIIYLFFARPTSASLWSAAGLIAVGLLLRGWAAGHLRKEAGVTVSGPYAHLRHPLYLGTSLILAGLAVGASHYGLVALIVVFYSAFYVPTLWLEERERAAAYPDFYALYRALVPALLPRLRPARFRQPQAQRAPHFELRRYWLNEEWRAAAGAAGLLLLLYGKLVLA